MVQERTTLSTKHWSKIYRWESRFFCQMQINKKATLAYLVLLSLKEVMPKNIQYICAIAFGSVRVLMITNIYRWKHFQSTSKRWYWILYQLLTITLSRECYFHFIWITVLMYVVNLETLCHQVDSVKARNSSKECDIGKVLLGSSVPFHSYVINDALMSTTYQNILKDSVHDFIATVSYDSSGVFRLHNANASCHSTRIS